MQFFRQHKLTWMLVAILMSSLRTYAQDVGPILDLPLEQLLNVEVTSASKYAQKTSEASSDILVITADDIRTLGYRTLADALNSLRSNDRNYSYPDVNASFGVCNLFDTHAQMLGGDGSTDIVQDVLKCSLRLNLEYTF